MSGQAGVDQLKHLVRSSLASGASNGSCEVLRARSEGRGMLMRLAKTDGDSVIVKAWQSRNVKEHIKRILRITNARREWRAHRHVERSGLAVPRPLLFFQTRCDDGRWFEVLVLEDLGTTVNGMRYLKKLLKQGDEAAIRRFEDTVLEMTRRLIEARIIDDDHQLRNIVVNGSDRPTRIDFECARSRGWLGISVDAYGRMLASLVCSHVHACQPEVTRSESFALRLAEQLKPPEKALAVAGRRIRDNLEKQRQRVGVDSQLSLGW